MKNHNYSWIFILVCFSFLLSCKKDKEGCKDSLATNFCSDCDASKPADCEFTGDVVFWYQKDVGDRFDTTGTSSLFYYLDGQLAGTTKIYHRTWPPDIIFGNPPSAYCGDDSALTVTQNWTGTQNHTYEYSVKNQSGAELYSGSIILQTKVCVKKQLY